MDKYEVCLELRWSCESQGLGFEESYKNIGQAWSLPSRCNSTKNQMGNGMAKVISEGWGMGYRRGLRSTCYGSTGAVVTLPSTCGQIACLGSHIYKKAQETYV